MDSGRDTASLSTLTLKTCGLHARTSNLKTEVGECRRMAEEVKPKHKEKTREAIEKLAEAIKI